MSRNAFGAAFCALAALLLAVLSAGFPLWGRALCLVAAIVLLIAAGNFLIRALADRDPRR